jgi:hypothetical protein
MSRLTGTIPHFRLKTLSALHEWGTVVVIADGQLAALFTNKDLEYVLLATLSQLIVPPSVLLTIKIEHVKKNTESNETTKKQYHGKASRRSFPL